MIGNFARISTSFGAAALLLISLGISRLDAQATDDQGLIKTNQWLVLGPFSTDDGCSTVQTNLLKNYIAPSHIACQFPAVDAEINYDVNDPNQGSLGYLGPLSPGGKPLWRAFDDGSLGNGDQNLDLDVSGNRDDVVSWLVTYIEYKGNNPALVEFCFGSDDGGQIWLDDQLIHSNNACRGRGTCQDKPAAFITKGVHRIAAAAFEEGGDWGLSLGLILNNAPVVDDPVKFPDWAFLGRNGGGFNPACTPPGTVSLPGPVTALICTEKPGSVLMTWTNPPGADPGAPIEIYVNQNKLASIAGSSTSHTVNAADIPAGSVSFCAVNSSGLAACCNTVSTDRDGLIVTPAWLVLGPFSEPFGCNDNQDDILKNFIAPSFIGCQYPKAGDTIDYKLADPDQGSTAYVGPLSGGKPVWRAFFDGSNDGDQNLDGDTTGDRTDVVSWLVTYFDYKGNDPAIVQFGFGSDDGGQIWLDDQLIHSNNACRGRGLDQDLPAAFVSKGVHRLAAAAFENDGGWGLLLRLLVNGSPVLDNSPNWPDWVFLGKESGGFNPPCSPPATVAPFARVENLSCVRRLDGGVDLSWTNPLEADPGVPLTVYANGNQIASRPGDDTAYTVSAANVPGPLAVYCVVNSSGEPACCDAAATDNEGLIKSSQWLALGAYHHSTGCAQPDSALVKNFIAPTRIDRSFPADGDEAPFDPTLAASDTYNGPLNGNNEPFWRPFEDGTNDGDQAMEDDLDSGGGGFSVTWLATYVEYKGAAPIAVDLCFGSDDGGQVWIDCQLALNNNECRGRGTCQANPGTPPYTLEPGIHRLAMAAWNQGGGWGASLGLRVGGVPVRDGDPDWVFYGRNRPASFVPPLDDPVKCPSAEPIPVENLTCAPNPGPLGGVVITWQNPDEIDPTVATRILINNVLKGTVAADAVKATILGANLPAGCVNICVVNFSNIPSCCSLQRTECATGLILTSSWLALGPFNNDFGCGTQAGILGNHIAPSYIGCQFPKDGDEIIYDPLDPLQASTGYAGPTSANDNPYWRAFDDGTDNGDQDFDADVTGPMSDVMTWLATYVEYKGAAPVDIEFCVGSDDGVQLWVDTERVHSNNACRCGFRCAGLGTCDDRVNYTMSPGVHRLALGIWENDGGWGGSLGIYVGGNPVRDGDPNWKFHGRTPPAGYTPPSCEAPPSPVTITGCALNAGGGMDVSWTNPPGFDPAKTIDVLVNGRQVAALPGSAAAYSVAPGDTPASGQIKIGVDDGSTIVPACGLVRGNEVLINCGGPEITDAQGRRWAEDTLENPSPFLTSPNAFTANFGFPENVNRTADPMVSARDYPAEIFPWERWNDGPIEYNIPLPADKYEVTLLFMEGCCSDGCEDIEDPALSLGDCRVFDIQLNDDLVQDQFSQNVLASQEAGTPLGAGSNYVAVALRYEMTIGGAGGGIGGGGATENLKILIDDLGGGNPPENASIKGIHIRKSGPIGKRLRRGDLDNSGTVDISDPINGLHSLFLGDFTITCQDSADFDDSGEVDITDMINSLLWQFGGGPIAPPPGPFDCGVDTTIDKNPDGSPGDLGCQDYSAACQ